MGRKVMLGSGTDFTEKNTQYSQMSYITVAVANYAII